MTQVTQDSDEKKDAVLRVRLSSRELQMVKRRARALGKTLSAYVRELLLE